MRKSDYLIKPALWADEITHKGTIKACDIESGRHVIFNDGNAYQVEWVEDTNIVNDFGRALIVFHCGGPTMGRWSSDDVLVTS